MSPRDESGSASPTKVGAWTLLLFLIWSNSFVAIAYLLGGEGVPARFDWLSLTVARFVPVGAICFVVIWARWRDEALRVVRRRWRRLLVCSFLAVPGYSVALYWGQQHGIPAPVASLETSLTPLFLMLWGALFLGEGLSKQKVAGFVVALVGLGMIAHAKDTGDGTAYPLLVAITALAPLAWSIHSALTKPISRECPPILWAYLVLVVGSAPLILLLPWSGGPELATLDAPGWLALVYLAIPCTVFGNAAWTWLVKHLPASSVGFTIFLNPPLTTLSKALLAALFPATFLFQIVPLEWLGGAVVLAGMAVALARRWPAPSAVPPAGE